MYMVWKEKKSNSVFISPGIKYIFIEHYIMLLANTEE